MCIYEFIYYNKHQLTLDLTSVPFIFDFVHEKMVLYLQIRNLRERGQEFLKIPDTYYDILRERLKADKINLIEDLNILQVCFI